jgi:hypothetical protein
MSYTYDESSGNMLTREYNLNDQSETFSYTSLNRLSEISVSSGYGCTNTITYSNNGNITSKTDAGEEYTYHPTRKHALTHIQNNPATISVNTQNVTYNPFNKASQITENNRTLNYTYGPDDQRKISQLCKSSA